VVCSFVALFAYIAVKEHQPTKREKPPGGIPVSSERAVIPAALRALRPVYPYSVIPGGVYAANELRAAMLKDDEVQQHYAGFDTSHVRFVTVAADCYRYVSYRRGNQIYWTKNKLRIPKGEVLFTDGSNYSRTRCGNRLAEQPIPQATSTSEPSAEALSPPPFRLSDTPESLHIEAASQQDLLATVRDLPIQIGPVVLPNAMPEVVTGARANSAWGNGTPAGIPTSWMPLVVVNSGAPGTRPGSGNEGSTPQKPPPVVPVPVPEPDEVIVTAAFLAAIKWLRVRARSGE
jgi:hypothetical protein